MRETISCRCTLMCWPAMNLKLGQSVMILSWREKLAFEKAKWETEQKRWEAEMEAKGAEAEERKRKEEAEAEERKRREEREFEEKKRKEEMEFEEKKRKEAMEYEERKRREALEAEQLELKKQELARQIDRDKAEDDRRDSSVAKGKLFGDAMRASTIRMGADPIDAIPFFSQRQGRLHNVGKGARCTMAKIGGGGGFVMIMMLLLVSIIINYYMNTFITLHQCTFKHVNITLGVILY